MPRERAFCAGYAGGRAGACVGGAVGITTTRSHSKPPAAQRTALWNGSRFGRARPRAPPRERGAAAARRAPPPHLHPLPRAPPALFRQRPVGAQLRRRPLVRLDQVPDIPHFVVHARQVRVHGCARARLGRLLGRLAPPLLLLVLLLQVAGGGRRRRRAEGGRRRGGEVPAAMRGAGWRGAFIPWRRD